MGQKTSRTENRWDSIACVRHVSQSLGEAKIQGNKEALTKRSLHVRNNSHHVKEIWDGSETNYTKDFTNQKGHWQFQLRTDQVGLVTFLRSPRSPTLFLRRVSAAGDERNSNTSLFCAYIALSIVAMDTKRRGRIDSRRSHRPERKLARWRGRS